MASSLVKSNRMKRMESKKSHSWWWDSHISPKNSRWLQENLDEMDQNVKRMLKLIEEDADSFAKKAELYFKKRPELVALVEEFYRMYRSLAERYDHVTGELKRNIPSDLQSQGSGVSDVGSEPPSSLPSDTKPARTKSGPRAAGFDFFLGSGGDESSTLDSESESDDSSVNNYSTTRSNGDEEGWRRRVVELEAELQETKEKLRREEISRGLKKCDHDEDELRAAEENMERAVIQESSAAPEQNQEAEVGLAHQIQRLVQEISTMEKKLRESEGEAEGLKQNLQDQVKSAQKEVAVWKSRAEREKREVSRLQDRVVRYKTNLSERDQEIRGLQESIGNANKVLAEENEQLQAEMARMTKERAYLEDNLKEMDLRRQSMDEDLRRVKAARAEMEVTFGAQIEQLKADVAERDDCVEQLNRNLNGLQLKHDMLAAVGEELDAKIGALGAEISSKDHHLHQLHLQHVETHKSAEELRARVRELEIDVKKKQEAILEGAEEKREAIRQLCFSIEHYRNGYHELRQAAMAR